MTTKVGTRTPAQGILRKAGPWPKVRFTTTLVFLLLLAGKLLTGGTSYVSIGPVNIACPLGIAQIMAASRIFIPALALAGLAGFLFIVFFGRAFCSWLCPGRWIFNRGPVTAKMPWRARAWIQRGLMAGVVGVAWVCRSPVFCPICPAGVICRGAIAAGTGGNPLPTFGWLGALVSLEWASGRSWCRDLCPLGATLSRLSRFNPFFKLKSNPEHCLPCLACQKACPEGLSLAHDTDFSTCTKCLACMSACPRGAVDLKLW